MTPAYCSVSNMTSQIIVHIGLDETKTYLVGQAFRKNNIIVVILLYSFSVHFQIEHIQ